MSHVIESAEISALQNAIIDLGNFLNKNRKKLKKGSYPDIRHELLQKSKVISSELQRLQISLKQKQSLQSSSSLKPNSEAEEKWVVVGLESHEAERKLHELSTEFLKISEDAEKLLVFVENEHKDASYLNFHDLGALTSSSKPFGQLSPLTGEDASSPIEQRDENIESFASLPIMDIHKDKFSGVQNSVDIPEQSFVDGNTLGFGSNGEIIEETRLDVSANRDVGTAPAGYASKISKSTLMWTMAGASVGALVAGPVGLLAGMGALSAIGVGVGGGVLGASLGFGGKASTDFVVNKIQSNATPNKKL